MHLALAEEISKEKQMLCDGDRWQEMWKRALFNSFLQVDSEIESVAPGNGSRLAKKRFHYIGYSRRG
ncbi:hypothetical protein EUTSA_v10003307mg [Eutrema salsugineum]|uniref:Uncharacterized protein n=1 Tax=Eutrema salsugineum TaxID=72664 RepID=V4LQI5_EUTSA|nr:hypothetical protein EUTSA_v10003307mg [Eutrema salsugineum]